MNKLFYLNAVGFPNIEWADNIPKSCSGLLIPDAKLASVHGGFGDMLFQVIMRPLFDAWFSDYKIIQGFTGIAGLDYRSCELTVLTKNNIYYHQPSFIGRNHKRYEINLSHSMVMDNKVRFEKDIHYSTFDLHYKLEVFEILMNLIPELIYPFLNEYYAGRSVSLFNEETYPNQEILNHIAYMMGAMRDKSYSPMLLDIRGILLLAHVFLWKAEITQKRGLDNRQAEISFNINKVMAELVLADEPFRGIDYYAKKASMSPTYFKKYFHEQTGHNAYALWQNIRLERAFTLLANSDDPVKLIAFKTGFATVQGFYKAFLKEFDMNPSDLRGGLNKR